MINQARASRGEKRMPTGVNRQILLVEKPAGKLGAEHFRLVEATLPEPKDGEALVRVRYISLDAANRAWMHGATYRSELETNAVMAGGGIAEVVESKCPVSPLAISCSAIRAGRTMRWRRASFFPSFPASSR